MKPKTRKEKPKLATTTTTGHNGPQSPGAISGGSQTPSRQMAQLALDSKPRKSKLLGSKSFSQIIQKSIFFRKELNQRKVSQTKTTPTEDSTVRPTTSRRSLSNGNFHSSFLPELRCRIKSDSLIVLPTQSTKKDLAGVGHLATSLEQPSISPIVCKSAQSIDEEHPEHGENDSPCNSSNDEVQSSKDSSKSSKSKDKGVKKLRPLKTTKMALRDVKNSLGLRMKAKQDNQAFTKLSNESTPATKLYSPFNIYTGSALKANKKASTNRNSADESILSFEEDDKTTPKRRIALQHKKHLLQTNQFNFVSPAGKLKETIQDVERFQQCIEDISKAIQSREQNNNLMTLN